ncbi:hypothetical protein GOODEAATRI_016397, partial [Goodea atripinnis]
SILIWLQRRAGSPADLIVDIDQLEATEELTVVGFFKILFVLVNVDEHRNGRLMEYFRVRHFEAPHIRLVNLTDHMTYHLPSETLDVEIIKQFCHSYLEGKAKLAEALKDREDVVVARIDASANDINMSMQGSYPSLCLFPAVYAERAEGGTPPLRAALTPTLLAFSAAFRQLKTRWDGDSGRVRRQEGRERPLRSGRLFHASPHHPQTAVVGKPPLPYV